MKRIVLTLIIAVLGCQGVALAQTSDSATEPEVVISPGKESWVKEYRINGQLYMIEITPEKGPSYFLIDMDGDGQMETRQNNVQPKVMIPRWILFSW